tara:strand:+ start:398 stop:604 length:207 start_codon:yes stop_codon:yes gene_type:complete
MKQQHNFFSFDVYSYDDYDEEKNKFLPSKKIFSSKTYDLSSPKDHKLFDLEINKHDINQINFVQRKGI